MESKLDQLPSLIEKFRKGDERALLEIREICDKIALRIANKMLLGKTHPYIFSSPRDAVDDAVSETWSSMLKKLMSDVPQPLGRTPAAFVTLIAKRRCLDFLRKIKAKNINADTKEDLFFGEVDDLNKEEHADRAVDLGKESQGSEYYWKNYILDIEKGLFPKLGEVEKVLFSSIIAQKTNEEVAKLIDQSVSTVKNKKKILKSKVEKFLLETV